VAQGGGRRRIEEDGLSIVRRRYPNSASLTRAADTRPEGTSPPRHPRLAEGRKYDTTETTLGVEGGPEGEALKERAITL
jgi:hypothetical protein